MAKDIQSIVKKVDENGNIARHFKDLNMPYGGAPALIRREARNVFHKKSPYNDCVKNDKTDIIVIIAHYLSAIITDMSQVDIASDLLINLQGLNEDQFYHIEELLGEVYGEEI